MASTQRFEQEGAIYHVLNRGNHRADDRNAQETRESLEQKLLDGLPNKARRSDLRRSAKVVDWRVTLAAAMKARTTVTNLWLAKELHMSRSQLAGGGLSADHYNLQNMTISADAIVL